MSCYTHEHTHTLKRRIEFLRQKIANWDTRSNTVPKREMMELAALEAALPILRDYTSQNRLSAARTPMLLTSQHTQHKSGPSTLHLKHRSV